VYDCAAKWGNNLQPPAAGPVAFGKAGWGSWSPRCPNARHRGHPSSVVILTSPGTWTTRRGTWETHRLLLFEMWTTRPILRFFLAKGGMPRSLTGGQVSILRLGKVRAMHRIMCLYPPKSRHKIKLTRIYKGIGPGQSPLSSIFRTNQSPHYSELFLAARICPPRAF
jgi:hypothetical protein